METSNKQGRIIPTNFGLKYNPPKLGIQYYFKENPKATFVHEVSIDNVELKDKSELINDLFTKHKKFIDPKVVSRNQLENLMERLKSNVSKNSLSMNGPTSVQVDSKPKTKAAEPLSKNVIEDNWGLDFDDEREKKPVQAAKSKVEEQPIISSKSDKLAADFGSKKDDLNKENMLFNERDREDHKNLDKDFMFDDNNDLLDGFNDNFDDRNDKSARSDDGEKNEKDGGDLEDDDDSDAIDIDNEEELAARGLKKIQIEGEEEEFLMDAEGNIYNLNGDFIGTTNGDAEDDEEDNF